MKNYYIYIVTSKYNGTLYTGVTSNLLKRIYEHKNHIREGFSAKYSCELLVYYEIYSSIREAISREKQIKNYPRKRKIFLIESVNPLWDDLYKDICF